MAFNKVILEGYLARTPDVKTINEVTIAQSSIAMNFRQKEKEKDKVTFIDIKAFNKLAELMGQYLVKGSRILIEGRLEQEAWEKDGVKNNKHSVIIETFQMLDSKQKE